MKSARRFSKIRAVGALLILVATAVPVSRVTAESPDQLEPLEFLAGAWGADEVTIEYWLPPLRGLMVGVNRSTAGDGRPFFEYLRIEAHTDGIYYIASPQGEGKTAFRLTEISTSRAVFENPEHDFPQKIIYTRTGDQLEAEVGAIQDGEWKSFKLTWSRQP